MEIYSKNSKLTSACGACDKYHIYIYTSIMWVNVIKRYSEAVQGVLHPFIFNNSDNISILVLSFTQQAPGSVNC